MNLLEDDINVTNSLGYPVILRSFYVIGGQSMCISALTDINKGTAPDVDCISDVETVLISGIMWYSVQGSTPVTRLSFILSIT